MRLVAELDENVRRLFPGVPFGAGSLGWSVPLGTPEDSPKRQQRANCVADVLASVKERCWDHDSWYCVYYGDPQNGAVTSFLIDDQLLPVLSADLRARTRRGTRPCDPSRGCTPTLRDPRTHPRRHRRHFDGGGG